jgi:hypothetical protein
MRCGLTAADFLIGGTRFGQIVDGDKCALIAFFKRL